MYKKTFLAAFAFTALNFLFTWLAAQHWDLSNMDKLFIDGKIIPTHWQFPIAALAMNFIMWASQFIDPHKEGLRKSKPVAVISILGVSIMLLIAQICIVFMDAEIISEGLGKGLILTTGYIVLLGISNYFSTARKSYLTGLPTPWTMTSDLSWAKTHRFLGRSLMLVTLTGFVTSFAISINVGGKIVTFGVLAALIVATIYSYIVWKGDPARAKS